MSTPATFRCGHPRTPENSTRGYVKPSTGKRYPQCKLCHRVHCSVRAVDRQLERWKQAARPTLGERIVRGIAL